ncbi:hypothetical protein CYMTET_30935, partial [Cymbomonas tetramitiformis]
VLLTRPTKFEDFVPNQKGIYQIDGGNQHSGWWKAAMQVLKLPGSYANFRGGVTPAVLSTEISRQLLEEIVAKNRDAHYGKGTWEEILFGLLDKGADWTEYTLYFAYAATSGGLERLHTPITKDMPSLYSPGDFKFGNWHGFKADRAFVNPRSIFTVVQGSASFPAYVANCPILKTKAALYDDVLHANRWVWQ